MSKNKYGDRFNVFYVMLMLLAHRFLPKYDVKTQLLLFQIKMLRDRIEDLRIIPTPEERTELLRLGAEINHDVADVMKVVKPGTYRRWMNEKAKSPVTPKPVGRPETPEETVKLVIQLATENIAWGYKRILGELKTTACEANGERAEWRVPKGRYCEAERNLEVDIGLTTIRDILKRAGHKPSPEKSKNTPPIKWSKFVSTHLDTLIACDYFTKPIYTLFGTFDAYVLVFIHLGSRRVFMTPPTFNPDDDWLKIQIRSASIWLEDIGVSPKYLIHDRDKKFSRMFRSFWEGAGVELIKIPPCSPQANAYCECYIGTFKSQCLSHFICFSLDQLDHINRQWVKYYNTQRPHQGKDIGNKILQPNPVAKSAGKIIRHEALGGVLAWYEREAA